MLNMLSMQMEGRALHSDNCCFEGSKVRIFIQTCYRHDDRVSYLQDLLMEMEVHLMAPSYTQFYSILIQNSDYAHMALFIVMCSLEAEVYLPPN